MLRSLRTGDRNNMDEKVTISREEYQDLIECKAFLEALEQAGVDNWEGYELARDLYQEKV